MSRSIGDRTQEASISATGPEKAPRGTASQPNPASCHFRMTFAFEAVPRSEPRLRRGREGYVSSSEDFRIEDLRDIFDGFDERAGRDHAECAEELAQIQEEFGELPPEEERAFIQELEAVEKELKDALQEARAVAEDPARAVSEALLSSEPMYAGPEVEAFYRRCLALPAHQRGDVTVLRELYRELGEEIDVIPGLMDSSNEELSEFDEGFRSQVLFVITALPQEMRAPLQMLVLGGLSKDRVITFLKTVTTLEPEAKKNASLDLLRGADGPEIRRAHPGLFLELSPIEIASAYVASERQKSALELCWEAKDPSERLEIAEMVCLRFPIMGANLPAELFSPTDRLAIGLRIARKDPEKFVRLLRHLDVVLTHEEMISVTQDVIDYHPASLPEIATLFRFSPEDVVSILDGYPEDKRVALLEGLHIPGTNGRVLKQEEQVIPSWEEVHRLFVRQVETLSQRLTHVIEQEFPDRISIERQRSAKEARLAKPIKLIGEIGAGSANAPLFITFEGTSLPGVYKPQSREAEFDRKGRRVRHGIDKGEGMLREWLAAQIDKAFQFDVVPATIVRDGPEGLGSVQEWRVGKSGESAYDRREWDEESLMVLAAFDVVVLHCDRHKLNYIISPDGQAQAIDNGYILSRKPDILGDGLRSYPVHALQDRPVSSRVREKVRRFRQSTRVQEALKSAFAFVFKQDAEFMWGGLMQRTDLLDPPDPNIPGKFPVPQWL